MLPPRWFRRVVLAPAVPLVTLLLLIALPVAVIAAAFASPLLPGRWRPLRVLAFAIVGLVVESAMVLWLAVLWIASLGGRRLAHPRWQDAHYRAMRWYLAILVDAARRAFNLRFALEVDAPVSPAEATSRPLVVLSRHAGPGDSFLLVHGLLQRGWRPRIVLREVLRWAPALDVCLGRLPTTFVPGSAPPGTTSRAIVDLAATMREQDALVLFPEGANFTPERRIRSIAKLEELGDHESAEHAREMRHVLTPRAGGATAALSAAPAADVVLVAHSGLEDLSSIVDLWRGVPMDAAIDVEVWRVDARDVPRTRETAQAWLRSWWRHIDGWLLERHGPGVLPDAAVDAVIGDDR